MPTYHRFVGSTGRKVVITDDRSGAKLPKREFGEWVYKGTVEIKPGTPPAIGGSHDDIAANVARDGFHEWPESKEG